MLRASFSKTYGSRVVVQDFALELASGEIIAIVGASGSGKTTVARILAGLVAPDEGGVVTYEPGATVAYAPQVPELADWRTAKENVSLEAELLNRPEARDEDRQSRLLELAGLGAAKDLLPGQLSVGMQHRVQLCRALFRGSSLIILDEPLAAVDELQRDSIAASVRGIFKSELRSAIWITHDVREAISVADRVLVFAGTEVRLFPVSETERHRSRESESIGIEAPIRQSLRERSHRSESTDVLHPTASDDANPRQGITQIMAPVLLGCILIALWQLASATQPGAAFYFSSPALIATVALREASSLHFWLHIASTASEALVGLILGIAGGLAIPALASMSGVLSGAIRPYLIGATAVPLFVLAPAFIIWFGVGFEMKVALAALSSGPIVALGVLDQFDVARSELARHLLNEGASRFRIFMRYLVPKGVTALLWILRPAGIAALIGAFLGEFISADRGLGYYILLNASRYHMDEVLFASLAFFCLALLFQTLAKSLVLNRVSLVRSLGL